MAHKRYTKKVKRQPLIFLLCGVFVLIFLGRGLYAKYVDQKSVSEDPIAEEFYFTSNFLSENGKDYILASNIKQLTFELRNYDDELRSSASNIEYTYIVTKDNKEISKVTGTIQKEKDGGNKNSITLDNLSEGEYTVEATATNPYKKSLKATFTIPKESEDIDYTINDSEQSPYVLLQVSTHSYDGNIEINWPVGLIPDSTQEDLENIKNYNGQEYTQGNIKLQVASYSSYTYRFFKKDTNKDYSKIAGITVEKITD